MYEVNINARPEQFLDWDRPLAKQGDIRPILESMPVDMFSKWQESGAWPHVTGQNIYETLAGHRTRGSVSAGTTADASRAFNESGIPGIRYLDQGSRGSGQGTSNYVVFDDKLIDILRKYGLAGLAAGPAAAGGASAFGSLSPRLPDQSQ